MLDSAEERRREIQRCGTPEADAGCRVTVRYLYQLLRARTPAEVFAQIVGGFELTRIDPRVVGFNLVQPEDYPVPMRDFKRASLEHAFVEPEEKERLLGDFDAALVGTRRGGRTARGRRGRSSMSVPERNPA